ncbi:unnamed protein product [Cyprideis torosa]|uniref:Uncharacterized protein n=1 Tax=Cyprideis torosa TaxID=163714 RepID=A0A7R8WQY0_9CRUS|nr:unnamed protein product [Cyprideis torosa]CAG0903187.1 unnamed protein product [Cyprideis torosa]
MYLLLSNVKVSAQLRLMVSSIRWQSTIFNLSSGRGKAGISVIRVSGPKATVTLQKLLKVETFGALSQSFKPRKAYYRRLYDPMTGEHLDDGVVMWFPGPKSFTGEDIVEFHVHGGSATVKAVLKAIGEADSDMRLSEAGEFTLRAFQNLKMDLSQVDGLCSLIDAETETERKIALRMMKGEIGIILRRWKSLILSVVSEVEASIDFGEDQHLSEETLLRSAIETTNTLIEEASRMLEESQLRGRLIEEGVKVAILGPPNAGKSSLLNLLCSEDLAIVSHIPGTTRDVIRGRVDFWGSKVTLLDTAGQREVTTDSLEMEGMRRGLDAARSAQLALIVLDSLQVETTTIDHCLCQAGLRISEGNLMLPITTDNQEPVSIPCKILLNKSDLLPQSDSNVNLESCVRFSCFTKDGLNEVSTWLRSQIQSLTEGPENSTTSEVLLKARHRKHVADFVTELKNFLSALMEEKIPIDIAAQHLRRSVRHLGAVTGETFTSDEVLGAIFSNFCIGK